MSQHEGAPQMTLGAGLAVWITAMVAIAGFAALGYFLKLAPLYAGFLFVWYVNDPSCEDVQYQTNRKPA